MKKHQRYILAVYLLLATISALMALVALNYLGDSKEWQGIILNLSTEIAGAVLIFLIVNKMFFIGDNSDISNKIDNLKNEINNKFNPLKSYDKAISSGVIFKNNTKDTSKFRMLGYTLPPAIRHNRGHIVNMIKNGVDIQIIILDIHSDAVKLINSQFGNKKIEQDYNLSILYIKKIQEEYSNCKGSLNIKKIQWIPSCSMYIVEKSNDIKSFAKISIYPPSATDFEKKRRIIEIVKSVHTEDFIYFSEQFDTLWKNGIEFDYKAV